MDSHMLLSRRQQWSYLAIILITSIFGGIVSHNIVSMLSPHDQTSNWIQQPSKHIEARDVDAILERGLGDLLSNLGKGALSSIESGVSSLLPNASTILSSLTSLIGGGNGSSILDSLAEPAGFLGTGLANGALTGLNMTVANKTAPSGVDGIAQNLGSGLTSAVFSSSSIKSLMQFNSSSLGSSSTIGQAALALAQGLGGGAASGLKMTTTSSKAVTNETASFNTSGINGVAGNFGQGLSQSLLSAVQLPSLKSLMSMGGSMFGGSSLNISAIGAGLGTGIGQGAAIGLGFQQDTASTSTSQDPAVLVQDFSKGLVSSFLQNGTITKLTDSLGNSSSSALGGLSLSNIDIAKVAEGLGVGLISGAGSTISTLQVIGADTTSFNDTVGGAATGFGRGLGAEGAKLVEQLIGGPNANASVTRRSLGDVERLVSLRRRDTATVVNATDLASVIASLNASTINPLLQTGIDDLTCEGVGGLAGVFLGLVNSKTIDVNALISKSSTSSTNTSLNLPDQVFIIKSGGNTYSLNPARGIMTVMINGMGLVKFIGVAAAHIIFAIIAYFVAIPLLLLLHSTQKLTLLINKRDPSSQPPSKWETYIAYSILPLAVLAFGLGVGFRAGGKHFTSAHEILGLIIFLQTLIAAGTAIFLKRQPQEMAVAKNLQLAHYINIGLMLFFSLLTLLFGFTDLSAVSLCITNSIIPTALWVALGWLLLSPLMLVVGLQGLLLLLRRMRGDLGVVVRKEDIVMMKSGEVNGLELKGGNYLNV
ncbi:hypothetical protein BDZ45DRAFT_810710 [Acephala macrosclerotiorum]|nr:hypothetical protein BDZ45DRAFT_810710 [Acephala macrosclerotiorum]